MPSAYDHARKARSIITRADEESRRLTTSERREVEKHLALAEGRKTLEADALTHGRPVSGDGTSGFGATPGRRFVESAGYKAIQDTSSRPQRFSSGLIEVSDGPLAVKGTLTSTTAGGPGGGLVPPHYEPGVVDTLFEPLGVTDLFGQSAINAGQIRYTVEGTADSGAAGVAEGGEKPESELALSETVEPVKKIATSIVVSDELLEQIAAELSPRYRPLPGFVAATGLRPEEWIPLQRADVDRRSRVLSVARTVSSGEVVPLAKTSASRRQVPLSVRALDALDELPARLDTPLLFPALAGGVLRLSNFRRREWVPAITAAAITRPARIYDLRSTFASNALAAGVSVFELARMMGTSVQMIERHYGTLLDGAGADIARRLDAFESAHGAAADERLGH